MSARLLKRSLLLAGLVASALLLGPAFAPGQQQRQRLPLTPESLDDPLLASLKRASYVWKLNQGPPRTVVDAVCLVPDVATFLEAIAAWDDRHYFPILLEEPELTPKFLRAFRPKRVLRFPKKVEAYPASEEWEKAVRAVGRAWSYRDGLKGDQVPRLGSPPTPGVVISAPGQASLAAGVALAAGRFQPFIRLQVAKDHKEILSSEDAGRLASDLADAISRTVPEYSTLGDRCDFVTLAADWPYRYRIEEGPQPGIHSLDDLLGRDPATGERWAYLGRLVGDTRWGIYAAMCSLFLRFDSATLFNAYSETDTPWSFYSFESLPQGASNWLPAQVFSGETRGNAKGFHEAFAKPGRTRFVMINSSGAPRGFSLRGRSQGYPADIPATEPAAVFMIHSTSAANPWDPSMVAGRWLANGAFAYFGSIEEPFLFAFRPPRLVWDLINRQVPLAPTCWRARGELFGQPWRLIFLGDPLLRVEPAHQQPERTADWDLLNDWPPYDPSDPISSDSAPADQLTWAMRTALLDAAHGSATGPKQHDLLKALMAIPEEQLPPASRQTLLLLRVDALWQARRFQDLRDLLERIPAAQRDNTAQRWLESSRMALFHDALESGDCRRLGIVCSSLIASDLDNPLKAAVTVRAGEVFQSSGQLALWKSLLLKELARDPGLNEVREELNRVEGKR